MYVEMVSGVQPFTAGRVCFFTLPPGYDVKSGAAQSAQHGAVGVVPGLGQT